MSVHPPAGGQLIPISTPRGEFRVWTKEIGDNDRVKLLLLHGGPGGTHEFFEIFDDYLPATGLEYIYYDQLGSKPSDQPDDPDLWDLDRFVDEVEQVRRALSLDRSSFVLFGQSWGGILAIEYALRFQEHLKGLVISNMMSSCRAYNAYATDVLMPAMNQEVLAEIKGFEARGETSNPRYMDLLVQHHYVHHVLRLPPERWPEPINRAFENLNPAVYVPMQGPSELGLSGKLSDWDRTEDLERITVPTLVIGARHDTMDPAWMSMMARRLPKGRYLECPNGGHLAQWDDSEAYFRGLIDFLRDIEGGATTS
jgi:proline iminopeptidase